MLDALRATGEHDPIDPCGENGEFHTFVTFGPGFGTPVASDAGEVVMRCGRSAYCDLLAPAPVLS